MPTGVTISRARLAESTRSDRPCVASCTSMANLARSLGVVHKPAAACSG